MAIAVSNLEESGMNLEELARHGREEVIPEIRKLKAKEIILYFDKVKAAWLENEEEIAEALTNSTSYSPAMVKMWTREAAELIFGNVDQMLDTLHPTARRNILDDWYEQPSGVKVHAEPRGVVGNVGVGNAFAMNIWSLTMLLATKNFVIYKSSSSDTASVDVLKQSMEQADPYFPLTKALHGVYWKGGTEETEQNFVNNLDALVVTGDRGTIKQYRKYTVNADHMFSLIEFPPRKGLQYILLPEEDYDLEALAHKMGKDFFEWDQYACFSPHAAIIQGSDKISTFDFITKFYLPALRELSEEIPSGIDKDFRKSVLTPYVKDQGTFYGFNIFPKFNHASDFRLMYKNVRNNISKIDEGLPLGRNQFVFEVDDLEATIRTDPNLNRYVQTVGLDVPEDKRNNYIDILVSKGVDRIVPIGDAGIHYMDAPHDSMIPVTKFVRYVADERIS